LIAEHFNLFKDILWQLKLVNKFVERQQRAIADLMNKVVLLETQLSIATDKLAALEAAKEDKKEDESFQSSEIKE
jgi:hypothetical protein